MAVRTDKVTIEEPRINAWATVEHRHGAYEEIPQSVTVTVHLGRRIVNLSGSEAWRTFTREIAHAAESMFR